MSTVNSTNPYADLGLATKSQQAQKKTLGQEDFLKLMTTQLQYQDPFKPMENGEFLGQMAQFSTVSSIQDLQSSFAAMAGSMQSSQALQAGGLIGRSVLVPSKSAYLGAEEALVGAIDVPSSGNVKVEISDASGQVVKRIDLGTQSAGQTTFAWDGTSDLGESMAAGTYSMKATLSGSGADKSLDTFGVGRVAGVAVDGNDLTLDLVGMASTPFSKVRQIF